MWDAARWPSPYQEVRESIFIIDVATVAFAVNHALANAATFLEPR
ncbi:hypothetical protein Pla52o_56460 [Novipirellula galeiformis]|uniref:Uncharacterized protein n=1 Tax=Novipirellula galeiformis TaxID=2528004 RepID=A0A5C6BIX4_9BACT|nr:hypothetical protein Pla52o_56460 [Novipirellula galeiformis]